MITWRRRRARGARDGWPGSATRRCSRWSTGGGCAAGKRRGGPVSALPAREPAASRAVAGRAAAAQWAQIQAAAPQAAATIQRYLQRLAAFLAPASVNAAENALRQFARWMITDAGLDSIA